MISLPLFKTRAFQIDLGRQPESLATLKRLLAYGARFGFNQCHLYVENSLRLKAFGPAGRGLAVDEIKDAIDYAQGLDIEIVPSLNLLAHVEHFLHYDVFKPLDEARHGPRQRWQRCHNCFCPSHPGTRQWAVETIAEVAALFPSPNLHVGLDETWMIGSCQDCRRRVAEIGLGGLFAEYANFLHEQVAAHRRRMWMWADMCFYYGDVIDRLPRDVVMVDWHYERIDELPKFSFRNWQSIDSCRMLRDAGFTVVAAGGCDAETIRTFSRYVAGMGVDTFLVTEWEGSLRFQENMLHARCVAGNLLATGVLPSWKTIGEQLLPENTPEQRREFLLAFGCRSVSLEGGLDSLRNHPDNLLHLTVLSETLGRQVVGELTTLRCEADHAARAVLQHGYDAETVLVPIRLRLENAVRRGREWWDVLDRLARRFEESAAERGIYEHARRTLERLEALSADLAGFVASPSATTFPFDPIELVVDFVIPDPCAHACRIAISDDGIAFDCIHESATIPMRADGTGELRIPVPRFPAMVSLGIGGYARLGVANIRCRTLAGTVLPNELIAVNGRVDDAPYLLEWDRKAAWFNEADVAAKWLADAAARWHSVTVAFPPVPPDPDHAGGICVSK